MKNNTLTYLHSFMNFFCLPSFFHKIFYFSFICFVKFKKLYQIWHQTDTDWLKKLIFDIYAHDSLCNILHIFFSSGCCHLYFISRINEVTIVSFSINTVIITINDVWKTILLVEIWQEIIESVNKNVV